MRFLIVALLASACISGPTARLADDAAPEPDSPTLTPDARPPVPDAKPVVPDAPPVVPDAKPVVPDAAPIVPDATPGTPDAAIPDAAVSDAAIPDAAVADAAIPDAIVADATVADAQTCTDPSTCPDPGPCLVATCNGGVCGSAPVLCAAPDQCHTASCNVLTNQCEPASRPDNWPCDDSDACTTGDTCQSGTCQPGTPLTCPTSNQCRTVTCDPASGCVIDNAKFTTTCDDGDACTTNDQCDGSGNCAGTPITCPAPDACHGAGTCSGGTCGSYPTANEGGSCDDNDACTSGDTCTAGSCGGTTVTCPGADECNDVAACDSSGGCPAPTAKTDGTPCTGGLCETGVCQPTPTVVSTTPGDGTSISATLIGDVVYVSFSEAMDLSSLSMQTTAGPCTGSIQVSDDGFTTCVAFDVAQPSFQGGGSTDVANSVHTLLVNQTYRVRVTTVATSAAGVPLASDYTSTNGFVVTTPDLCDASVVISQIYSESGGTYDHDFVELFNRGSSTVSLTGWSLQYADSGTSWSVTPLSGSIPAGGYYLVEEAAGTGGSTLPTPDATGTIDLASDTGKVALVTSTTPLGSACPSVVDLVPYGSADCSPAAASGSGTASMLRVQSGCGSTGDASADFYTALPVARNSATSTTVCNCDVENESGASLEADYCVVQYPSSISDAAGTPYTIYGRLFEGSVTTNPGADPNVRAQLGYSFVGSIPTTPEYESGWIWQNASYNPSCTGCGSSNDEYQSTLSLPPAGNYLYAYRFSLDQGVSWTYCDVDGAGSNTNPDLTFTMDQVPTMTTH